ncbi:unnamed protein product, partial [Amoebophrya sp. A25]
VKAGAADAAKVKNFLKAEIFLDTARAWKRFKEIENHQEGARLDLENGLLTDVVERSIAQVIYGKDFFESSPCRKKTGATAEAKSTPKKRKDKSAHIMFQRDIFYLATDANVQGLQGKAASNHMFCASAYIRRPKAFQWVDDSTQLKEAQPAPSSSWVYSPTRLREQYFSDMWTAGSGSTFSSKNLVNLRAFEVENNILCARSVTCAELHAIWYALRFLKYGAVESSSTTAFTLAGDLDSIKNNLGHLSSSASQGGPAAEPDTPTPVIKIPVLTDSNDAITLLEKYFMHGVRLEKEFNAFSPEKEKQGDGVGGKDDSADAAAATPGAAGAPGAAAPEAGDSATGDDQPAQSSS